MTRTPSTLTCTITPFAEDGTLDESAWRTHLDRLATAGMGVYVGSSSPGEGYTLSLEETETLYGITVDVVRGRGPARAMGVETHTAAEYLQIVSIAEKVGLEAMQIYCVDSGHANKPTTPELELYFRTILDRSSIPCVLSSHIYNGYVLPFDLVDRLLTDYPERILGINVTNPDMTYVARLVDTIGGRCEVHCGGPMQALTMLALGGQGFLSTDGNIIPETCVDVVRTYSAGDIAASDAAYAQVLRFFSANLWPGGSMRYLKAIMRLLGMPGHTLRPPFLPLDPAADPQILEQLDGLGIPELQALRSALSGPANEVFMVTTEPTLGPLAGLTVVVTGGNGGIGQGIAKACIDAGAQVMIWARNEQKTALALEALRGQGGRAEGVGCDVADEGSVEAAMGATLAAFGRVDGVVANAATPGTTSRLLDMDTADWRCVIETNLTGVMHTFRAGARQMVEHGEGGSLLAVSSIITRFGAPGRSHYAASKSAVHSLVTSAAIELARHRIRCNSLAPGWTRTDLVEEGFTGAGGRKFEEAIVARTPARRWGNPADYAAAAVMLLNPTLSFHTGDLVTVDGGYTIF